ncbi:MAG: DUF58 domain-containing protein [Chlorogloea purpurea SAG 13.99]|nr:DUF58 domain-containing protein [Chlorogloea purpurea SAG 13.99]
MLGIFDTIILGLTLIDILRVRNHTIAVKRLSNPRLSVGRDNPITLNLTGNPHKAEVIIKDGYPRQFAVSKEVFTVTVHPHSKSCLTYTIKPDRRGQVTWDVITLRQKGLWGLGWYQWQTGESEEITVYPDLMALRALSIRLTLESTGTMRQARRLGTGTEFAELREYSRGDDLRFVDWKATARRNTPFIRVLEPEKEQPLIILLDRGRLMTSRVQGLLGFDWGLNATLCLATAALHRGDKVGVGVFDREMTAWIPPKRGQSYLSHIVEKLSPLQPVLMEPDYAGALSSLVKHQSRRALVVLITDIVDAIASAELLAAMIRLSPRYLPFCVTLRDPVVNSIASTSTETAEGAYQRAVALDLLSQRESVFALLKSKGVLVLDAPANGISEALVDRYLSLKARSIL